MKTLFRISDSLLVNFAEVRAIVAGVEPYILWKDGSQLDCDAEEAELAILRHRELYDDRAIVQDLTTSSDPKP